VGGRFEVQHGDGHPVVDGVPAALLGPPEPVHLDQPERAVAQRDPLVALEHCVVLAERLGGVAEPRPRRPDLEVAELLHRQGPLDLGLPAPEHEAVLQASPQVLGGLLRAGGRRADQDHGLPVADPLREVMPPPVRLPGPQGGQPAVHRVPLGLGVTDHVDLEEALLPRLGRGDDLLGPGVVRPGLRRRRPVRPRPQRRRREEPFTRLPARPEPAEVEGRPVVLGLRGGAPPLAGLPLQVPREVQGGVRPLGPRQGHLVAPVRLPSLVHRALQLWTVRKRWFSAPS
jgi:hypothetical protein